MIAYSSKILGYTIVSDTLPAYLIVLFVIVYAFVPGIKAVYTSIIKVGSSVLAPVDDDCSDRTFYVL